MSEKYFKRVSWIDIAKGIGIFLIVFGHTIQQTGIMRQILYSFHVPLFFVISGLTYKSDESSTFFLKKKIKGLLIPYWAVGLISIIVILLINQFVHLQQDNTNFFVNVFGLIYGNYRTGLMWWNRPLWFIPCLFITLLFVDLIEKIFVSNNQILRGGV